MVRRRNLGLLMLFAIACGGGGDGKPSDGGDTSLLPSETWPEQLSTWQLFEGDGRTQTPVAGVEPYAPASALFSDYAAKHRFVRLPTDTTATYDAEAAWDFPVGTVLVKTFAYPYDERTPEAGERLIETRLIVRRDSGWDVMTYTWDDAQTAATRSPYGSTVPVAWIDGSGTPRTTDYEVPNTNQCSTCHGLNDTIVPLGLTTRQLGSQVDHFASLGWFATQPPPADQRDTMPAWQDTGAALDARARAYLDANCAHCHRSGAKAGVSGFWTSWYETDSHRLGICKSPAGAGKGSCGLSYDVVPSDPDASILMCRIQSTDPEIKMPELPTRLVHTEAVALLREWIAAMAPVACE